MKVWFLRVLALAGLCLALAGTGAAANAQVRRSVRRYDRRVVLRDETRLRRLETMYGWERQHHRYAAARRTRARIRALRQRERRDRTRLRHDRGL